MEVFEAWREGVMTEEERPEDTQWRELANDEEYVVEFRVREERLEMRVKMWVWSWIEEMVTAITDSQSRIEWDERIEAATVLSDEGSETLVHYDMVLGEERFPMTLLCRMEAGRDSATVEYRKAEEAARLHEFSSYVIEGVVKGRGRSKSVGNSSRPRELQQFTYTTVFTPTSTRLLLPDLLGKQTYFLRTWTHLQEYLELGFSNRSRVLPPLSQPHRSIAVSQRVVRYLVA